MRMNKVYHQVQLFAIWSEKVIQKPPAKIAGELKAFVNGQLIRYAAKPS